MSNRKTRHFLLILAGVIFVAVGIVTYNRVTMEREKARTAVPPPATTAQPQDRTQFRKDGELHFLASDGETKAVLDIEIADNDESRERGLMFRQEMAESQGMLFIFPTESIRSFWMKNTLIPLDLIFVNSSNRIVTILENTHSFDESSYMSTAPALYVIEVNAGYAKRHQIKVGDAIRWNRL